MTTRRPPWPSRDTLGFEVRNDVGHGGMRWITVGPADQPGTSILLGPPAADPGVTDDERRTIAEMMAKGTYGWILLATADLDGTFERLQASAEVVQEPANQPYGVRDCAVRDQPATSSASSNAAEPSGNRTGGQAAGTHSAHGGASQWLKETYKKNTQQSAKTTTATDQKFEDSRTWNRPR